MDYCKSNNNNKMLPAVLFQKHSHRGTKIKSAFNIKNWSFWATTTLHNYYATILQQTVMLKKLMNFFYRLLFSHQKTNAESLTHITISVCIIMITVKARKALVGLHKQIWKNWRRKKERKKEKKSCRNLGLNLRSIFNCWTITFDTTSTAV